MICFQPNQIKEMKKSFLVTLPNIGHSNILLVLRLIIQKKAAFCVTLSEMFCVTKRMIFVVLFFLCSPLYKQMLINGQQSYLSAYWCIYCLCHTQIISQKSTESSFEVKFYMSSKITVDYQLKTEYWKKIEMSKKDC